MRQELKALRELEEQVKAAVNKPGEEFRKGAETRKSGESAWEKRDSAYMDAYFDGDDDRMQEIIDEAADSAGYKYKAYHHTGAAFTVFDRSKARRSMDIQGFFFSADPEAEREYGPVRYDVYLKMENPYVVDSVEKMNAIPWDNRQDAGVRAREWLQAQGYDGVIRDAEVYGGEADEYVVFEPEQIKSAEPVTYSDDENGEGEVIPPSERFNEREDDIRWEKRKTPKYAPRLLADETSEVYNKRTWALHNNVLSHSAYVTFLEDVGAIARGEKFPRLPNGKYVIPTGEKHGVNNQLVITNGRIDNTSIDAVITINTNDEVETEIYRDYLIDSMRKGANYESSIQTYEDLYGKGLFVVGTRDSVPSLQALRRQGRDSGKADSADRAVRDGGRSAERDSEVLSDTRITDTEAPSQGAFSDDQNLWERRSYDPDFTFGQQIDTKAVREAVKTGEAVTNGRFAVLFEYF